MKKIIPILLLTTIFACSEPLELNKKNLMGNWQYCDSQNEYAEIYVSEKKFIYTPEWNPYGIIYSYEFIGPDSLHTFTDVLESNVKIVIVDSNNIECSFIKNDKEHTILWNRIPKKIKSITDFVDELDSLKYYSQKELFQKEYFTRYRESKCQVSD